MSGVSAAIVMQLALITSSPAPSTYGKAYNEMIKTGKPLVVMVGATWCPACQQMKGMLPQLQREGRLNQVAFATVDLNQQGPLARKLMQGTRIPQLIMFTKNGDDWTRVQLTGAQSHASVTGFIHQGVQRLAMLKAKKQN